MQTITEKAVPIISTIAEKYFSQRVINLDDFESAIEEALTDPSLLAAQNLSCNEWISVKDQLPHLGEAQFSSVKVLAVTSGYVRELIYSRDHVRKEVICRWHNSYGLHRNEVTHWMPLPSPPQTDKP